MRASGKGGVYQTSVVWFCRLICHRVLTSSVFSSEDSVATWVLLLASWSASCAVAFLYLLFFGREDRRGVVGEGSCFLGGLFSGR